MYNAYLPGNKHAPRLERDIYELHVEVTQNPAPETRKYLILEVQGEVVGEECDFTIPTIKYNFKWFIEIT